MPATSSAFHSDAIDYRIIVGVSLLLSIWLIAIDPILNRDAITYLRTADAYLENGLVASQEMFGRPLISICFATLHQITGLPLLYSALLVNSLMYALLCVAFVAAVRELGGNRTVQIFAAIVILSHPMINAHRSSIMRDPAFWAFSLLAFTELVRYVHQPAIRHQLLWYAYIALATLFRFEGLFFAALAPLTIATIGHHGQRVSNTLKLMVPPLLAIVATVFSITIYEQVISPGAKLFPDITLYIERLLEWPEQFSVVVEDTGKNLLEHSARGDVALAALAGLFAVLTVNILWAITWPYVALLGWGLWDGAASRLRRSDIALLRGHLLIAFTYLLLFTLINRFMLERYSHIFVLFALLCLPFILNALWQRFAKRGRIALVVLLAAMCLDTVHNRDYQKVYIRDAKDWVVENTPEDAKLVSNHRYIAYFSNRPFRWDKPSRYKFDVAKLSTREHYWDNADYLAVSMKRREYEAWDEFLAKYELNETAVFDGGKLGKVSIIQLTTKATKPPRVTGD